MKIIKKITLIIIIILGLTACFNNESNIIETTKEIELDEYFDVGNYKVKKVEDIAAFCVTVMEIKAGNKATISEVKNNFIWNAEKDGKEKYIVSAKYKDTTFLIPTNVKDKDILNFEVSFKKGDFYIERKGIKSSTSELPFQLAVMEILNNEKYIDYLK
ncbi:hypothetical protein [Fusobacterium nucleatum]|uniref:hypothetical protein n=1 Tax=Fusobacterium nucleatum TaxID=851 RepID=UPI00235FBFA7|nr:hypothetical protein [Fusobacterium nucleatum]WDA46451.1 hypothetical protein PSR67_02755 [Fusobacterium nucleatum]